MRARALRKRPNRAARTAGSWPSLAAALVCLLSSGCEPERQSRTVTVITTVELAGASEILMVEDERSDRSGRLDRHLHHPDPKTRARAALAAGRLRWPGNQDRLLELAKDPDKDVRAAAAWALGRLATEPAWQALDDLAADSSADVRFAALEALGFFPPRPLPAHARALLETTADSRGAADILGQALVSGARLDDASVIGPAQRAASHADPELRWRAAWALGQLRAPGAAAELTPLLDDADPKLRSVACLGLGRLRDPTAVPSLARLLADPDPVVAAAAAAALEALDPAPASDALGQMAADPNLLRKFAALQALSRHGLNGPALQREARSDNPYVRALAVDGLSRARDAGGVRKASKDDDWRVRAAAARGLARLNLTRELAEMQYDADARVVPDVLRGLSSLDYKGLNTTLVKHLEDSDTFVRATAADLVAERGQASAAENLFYSLETFSRDELPEAHMAALTALMQLAPREPETVNAVKRAVNDSNWMLQNFAYDLLVSREAQGQIPRPEKVLTLRSEPYYDHVVSQSDLDYEATLTTDKGTVVFRLYPKLAPLSVAHFENLCNLGVYKDLPFHRLEPGVALYAGDPRGDGRGYYPAWVRDEPVRRTHPQFGLGIEHGPLPDSGRSVFYVSYAARPELDGKETMFGELTSGAEVLTALGPGDVIRDFRVVRREFRGEFVREQVDLDSVVLPVTTPTPQPGTTDGPVAAAGAQPPAEAWQRPPTYLFLAGIGGLALLAGLLPLLSSTERRSDYPIALWIVLAIMGLVALFYLTLILSGSFHAEFAGPRPGDVKHGEVKAPKMTSEAAGHISTFGLVWVVVLLGLMAFLAMGQPLARWLAVLAALAEIGLLTVSIFLRTHWYFAIAANVFIGLNLIKLYFLLIDARTGRFFRER